MTADNATSILNTVAAFHDLMDSRKVSLKEAARLTTQALAEPSTSTKKVADKGWDELLPTSSKAVVTGAAAPSGT